MKKFGYLVVALFALVLVLAACGKDDTKSSGDSKGDKVTIHTTVFPLKSFAEQIGGDHVEVESIYPAGADLHDFEPTQKDIIDAAKADLFIYTGDNLDPVAKKVAAAIKEDDKKLSLEKTLKPSQLLSGAHDHEHEGEHDEHGEAGHHHGKYDPHVWLNPQFNQVFAKAIKDELVKKDPDHKAEYEKNYKKLDKDLAAIDADMKAVTKDKQDQTVFISHESLGYLAKTYGFEQVGIQNLNAEDPSQKELTEIVKAIKDSGAKYILYEDNVSHKVTDTIRKSTKAEPLKFYNMESVSKAQMKDKDLTYQSLMKQNIKNIDKALIKVDHDDADHDHDHEGHDHEDDAHDHDHDH